MSFLTSRRDAVTLLHGRSARIDRAL